MSDTTYTRQLVDGYQWAVIDDGRIISRHRSVHAARRVSRSTGGCYLSVQSGGFGLAVGDAAKNDGSGILVPVR